MSLCSAHKRGRLYPILSAAAFFMIFVARPAAAEECDPNYANPPCVPIASDVDCAGGRGNGPAYVKGPVKVIGRDIYRLDRDRNGIGCEPPKKKKRKRRN